MLLDSRRLFGTNGIRGIMNRDLTPQLALQTGLAVGTFFRRKSLIVGHDVRKSSPLLTGAIVAGLNATGCDVFLVGLIPTPTLQFWIKNHEVNGGVMVTASHNPAEYNGIKVIWTDGIELPREQEIKVENAYFNNRIALAKWDKLGGTHQVQGLTEEYVTGIVKHVDVKNIRRKRYRVAVDVANSVGGLTGPLLLRKLGCHVTIINSELDGSFPGRLPEPRPENLGELSSAVKSGGADLGVAFDSDADRVVFLDENGRIASGDESFGLIEKHFLMKNPGEKIVTSISSSTMIEDIAKEHGGRVVWTKIGSVTVSRTMKKLNVKLGGEEYGGIFYGPHQPVRDGAMATALVLDILTESGQKLSELMRKLPRYFVSKRKIECPENSKKEVLRQLLERVDGLNINTLDGIKIRFGNKSSVLIRPSGTEPVYRLYSEARTAMMARQLASMYSSIVKEIVEGLKARTCGHRREIKNARKSSVFC